MQRRRVPLKSGFRVPHPAICTARLVHRWNLQTQDYLFAADGIVGGGSIFKLLQSELRKKATYGKLVRYGRLRSFKVIEFSTNYDRTFFSVLNRLQTLEMLQSSELQYVVSVTYVCSVVMVNEDVQCWRAALNTRGLIHTASAACWWSDVVLLARSLSVQLAWH